MYRIFLYILFFFLLLTTHTFISSIRGPFFNVIHIMNITIFILFLKQKPHRVYIIALILGAMLDILALEYVGITSLLYATSLSIIILLQQRLFTQQNRLSVFILSLIFNMFFFTVLYAVSLSMSVTVVYDLGATIVVNATVTFIAYVGLSLIEKQIHKRFI